MRVILFVLLCVGSMYAHKLSIFLQQEDETVYVSAYFASGAFCKTCKVEVLNKNKKIIQTGVTNTKGEFEITKLDSLIYVGVDAGSGHMVQKSIEILKVKKEESASKELSVLKEENKRLKREIELLKEKNSFSDIFKMVFALLVIVGIFFVLKRVKK
mgnify:CR=1 FL=1